jgi:serine/threonine protein kinase
VVTPNLELVLVKSPVHTFRSIGKVQILSELGTGAGSHVFHVRRRKDGRDYALKVVAVSEAKGRSFLDQVRNEFRVGQMLDHPNLMKVHALDIETDWLFRPQRAMLLAELIRGRTLDYLPPMPPSRLAAAFAQVADAVGHMHDRGLIHADLKPNNLILGRQGVKVIDFGLAFAEGKPKHRARGTPEYMAPETKARTHLDRRTDVFNLGATLYYLLTHRRLPATQLGLILDEGAYHRQLVPVAALNPAVPSGLCDAVHRCIEYDPDRRPQTMTEVAVAFRDAVRP